MGQEYKEVCVTMVKMSRNRKCQIPQGKTKTWVKTQAPFLCVYDEIMACRLPQEKKDHWKKSKVE